MAKIKIDGKYTNEEIKALLLKSDKAILRAILVLYDSQDDDEKEEEATKRKNNIGFDAYDARLFSSIAKKLKKGKTLTVSEMTMARYRIPRYSRQLTKIANSKIDMQLRWTI